MKKATLFFLFIIAFSGLVLGFNNPGHDSLYVLKVGDTISGSLNVTDDLNVTGKIWGSQITANERFFSPYLTIRGNGSTGDASPNKILGSNAGLFISSPDLYFNYGEGGIVRIGSQETGSTVNIHGSMTLNDKDICLADGTNCLTTINLTGEIDGVLNASVGGTGLTGCGDDQILIWDDGEWTCGNAGINWDEIGGSQSNIDVTGFGGITSGDISDWNEAYGWGDHSAEGYLTSAEAGVQGSGTSGHIAKWTELCDPEFGTIIDGMDDVCWLKETNSTRYDWAGAKAYCEGLTTGGLQWELASREDWEYVFDKYSSSYAAHLNTKYSFDELVEGWYWTSTPHSNTSYAWLVHLDFGFVSYDDFTYDARVVCVSRLDDLIISDSSLYEDSEGRIGVGTTSPSATLDVDGTIRVRGGSPSAGYVLTSDADGLATWEEASGGVSEINTGAGLTGGPITESGTINLTGQALALHQLNTDGFIVRTGVGTVATRTLIQGTGIIINNPSGLSGSPVISLNTTHTDSLYASHEYVDTAVEEAGGSGSAKNVFDSWNIGGAAPSYSKCPFSVMSGNDITFAVLDDGSTCTGGDCPDYCSPTHCLWAANKTGCDGFYVVNGCGYNTVLDTLTDTCFMRDWGVGGSKEWEDAVNYCKGLALCNDGTYVEGGDCSNNNGVYNDDWHLPTRHELLRVVDYGMSTSPMIIGGDNNIFENVENSRYWSSSRRQASNAWAVRLYDGPVLTNALTNNLRVVCVSRS